ncbi:hypothetical protein C8Q78DRAFT_813707 [Trametes maxima]|nr:hypothetical protein C8Q78DRAFT_813707 [Trametes maxima]
MSTSTLSIPNSQQEFESQLETLLAGLGLETRKPEEITDEFLAEHLLEASDDKIEGRANVAFAQASFFPVNKLNVTKRGSAQPNFNGTTAYQWNGASIGALANINQPAGVQFFALDGLTIPYVPLKFLVVFFYNPQNRKFAVFVGKPPLPRLSRLPAQRSLRVILHCRQDRHWSAELQHWPGLVHRPLNQMRRCPIDPGSMFPSMPCTNSDCLKGAIEYVLECC